jgi:hypothetical protein
MFMSICVEKPIALIKGIVKPRHKSLFSLSQCVVCYKVTNDSEETAVSIFRVQITLPSENDLFNYLISLFNFLVPVAPPVFNFLFTYYFILPTVSSETAPSVFGSCVLFYPPMVHNIFFLSSLHYPSFPFSLFSESAYSDSSDFPRILLP